MVVTIPEGLKLSETVAISSSLRKLFDRNSLIRSISAPEIMSRCTDICVETTGCLTENKVKIQLIFLGGEEIIPADETYRLMQHMTTRRLLECILYSSNSYYELISETEHRVSGQETEIGLINLLVENMSRWVYEAQIREILDENKSAKQIPFNSDKKWMAVLADQLLRNRVFMIPEAQDKLNNMISIFDY